LQRRIAPRAGFKVDADLARESEGWLPKLLSQRLSAHYRASRVEKLPLSGPWIFELQLGSGSTFMVGVKRIKRLRNEWFLLVTPGRIDRSRTLLALIRGTRPKADSAELLQICHSIHGVLIDAASISAVRWYFRGSSVAVRTPEELLEISRAPTRARPPRRRS
jgi:hypothetical protein